MTAADAAGSQANTWPRCSTLGQEMLTSMAVTPAASDSRAASSAYSATVPPAMDTTARAPRDSSQGRSRCRNESMPGPCRPIELSIPLGVSAIRGVGRPDRGPSMTDLVTMAPILDTSMNWASSRPELAQPGGGQDRVGQLDVAQPGPQVSHGRAARPCRCWPPRGPCRGPLPQGCPPRRLPAARPAAVASLARRVLGSQPGAPNASNGIVPTSSQRTCSPRNTGPSTQERTMRVIPSLPVTGSTQVMQTPIPQAMASSTQACTGMS